MLKSAGRFILYCFTQKLKSLLAEYPTIDVKAMGFPAGWQNELLWKCSKKNIP
jgi:hypothetical protein